MDDVTIQKIAAEVVARLPYLRRGFLPRQRLVALTGDLSIVKLRFVVGSGWIV
jgi:hypothetical protein